VKNREEEEEMYQIGQKLAMQENLDRKKEI
jgi:hypothetical protein